jgi:hypothetical protein
MDDLSACTRWARKIQPILPVEMRAPSVSDERAAAA